MGVLYSDTHCIPVEERSTAYISNSGSLGPLSKDKWVVGQMQPVKSMLCKVTLV